MSGENETDYALTVQTVPVLEKKIALQRQYKKNCDINKQSSAKMHALQSHGGTNNTSLHKTKGPDKTGIQISDEGLAFILGDESKMFLGKIKTENIIYSDSTTEKNLFYSEEMKKQLDTLYKIFDRKNFTLMRKRLEAKKLCHGVAVMLYGEPGTGKKESVYQIAKKTGRNIIHVDISEAKSCWLGQSQKQIKKIFTDYGKLCKEAVKRETDSSSTPE